MQTVDCKIFSLLVFFFYSLRLLKIICYFCIGFIIELSVKLHIFNPEHDLSLAANLRHFTPPAAARMMRDDLDYLPMLWADADDLVLVRDVDRAKSFALKYCDLFTGVQFVTESDIIRSNLSVPIEISPWGWDLCLLERLNRMGAKHFVCPSDRYLSDVRSLSHRSWAASNILPVLKNRVEFTLGESQEVTSLADVERCLRLWGMCVVKAPWSCSGRGVRYIKKSADWERNKSWVLQIISQQGSVMTEPYYINKVMDFAMEFNVRNDNVCYEGLSVFSTQHTAYSGSVLASEQDKLSMFPPAVRDLIVPISAELCGILENKLCGLYEGPLGVDMMVVLQDNVYKIHPCVEVNLRRTMGHVAIAVFNRCGLRFKNLSFHYEKKSVGASCGSMQLLLT